MTKNMLMKFQNVRRAALALACCAVLALAAAGAQARQGSRPAETVVDSLLTKAGPLSIIRVGEETELRMELRLGGKKVLDLSGNMSASFVAHFREMGAGEVVLMSLGSGGSGCPAQFQIVRIEGAARVAVTDEFGDCADAPTITLQQLPDEQLTLRFPGYYRLAQAREPGFRKPPPTTWVYSKGVLKEQKAAAPRRGK